MPMEKLKESLKHEVSEKLHALMAVFTQNKPMLHRNLLAQAWRDAFEFLAGAQPHETSWCVGRGHIGKSNIFKNQLLRIGYSCDSSFEVVSIRVMELTLPCL